MQVSYNGITKTLLFGDLTSTELERLLNILDRSLSDEGQDWAKAARSAVRGYRSTEVLVSTADTALNNSIDHWERLLSFAAKRDMDGFIKESISTHSCALCTAFRYEPLRPPCDRCPVKCFSGLPACQNTPYEAVAESVSNRSDPMTHTEWYRLSYAVLDELSFLRSLQNKAKVKP